MRRRGRGRGSIVRNPSGVSSAPSRPVSRQASKPVLRLLAPLAEETTATSGRRARTAPPSMEREDGEPLPEGQAWFFKREADFTLIITSRLPHLYLPGTVSGKSVHALWGPRSRPCSAPQSDCLPVQKDPPLDPLDIPRDRRGAWGTGQGRASSSCRVSRRS